MLRAAVALLSCLSTVCAGCMFRDLQRNLREYNRFGFLVGTVLVEPAKADDGLPIIVFAYGSDAGSLGVADTFLLARPGAYFLTVPVGTYRVGAFVDRSGDFTYVPGEPAVMLDTAVEARPGEVARQLDLTIRAESPGRLPFEIAIARNSTAGVDELPQPVLGDVVSLDDPRFSDAAAQTGLWRPVDFLFDVGAGVYFLEPYDPDRIPVLFVHGAVGHPGDWAFMVARLDRTRFQPWLLYYPSGVRIEVIAGAIDGWIHSLAVRYHFRKSVVIAHSMGGLVARAVINRQAVTRGDEDEEPTVFVTLSTPWQGHAAAARGVEQAPVVVPAWYDLAPGSPFQTELLATPLPSGLRYYLLFTYAGGSTLLGEADDGTVTLASQLDLRAQLQAARVMGFNATHRGVLRSPVVADELARILAAGVASR